MAAGEDVAAVDGGYDVLLVVGAKQIGLGKIAKAARQLRLPEEKLLGDWIACIPGFMLKKYRQLQRSRLSIFSKNCFGGLISRTFGLPIRSPLWNLFVRNDLECLYLYQNIHACLEKKLTFLEMRWHDVMKRNHPVACLGNVGLMMVHHLDFETAEADWNKYKARINWFNLFVMMFTKEEKILAEFDALPYGKKVCFVPFKSDLDSAWYIDPKIDFDRKEEGFYDVVNNFARGKHFYYDPFDMLLYGKKTQLIDM